jgi:L-threonylcarbamoyladenylate synthase
VTDPVEALRAGKPVVLPFDTVYGLAAEPYHEDSTLRLYELKGRAATQPTALVTVDLDYLLECVPELRGRAATLARQLLPGPLTLVVPNPARRFSWLAGARPDTLGVRVPDVSGIAKTLLEILGPLAATSANLHDGADPRRVGDLAPQIASAAVVVDGGELPGTPSTVLDLTGRDPVVLREGAVPTHEALTAVHRLLGE